MEAKQLEEILKKHEAWRRGEADGERADLAGADLKGAYMRGADLKGANLMRTDLEGADLWKADLRGSNLMRAGLLGANLWKADLRGVNLIGINLEGADLRWANLEGTDLRWTNLEGADLRRANLEGADLKGAILAGVILSETKLDFPAFNFSVGRHLAVTLSDRLYVGCECHSWDVWLKDFRKIGERAGYSEEEIRRHGEWINFTYHTMKEMKGVIDACID